MKKNKIKSFQRLLEQIKFEKAKSEYTDREVQMELLYSNKKIFKVPEKTLMLLK